MKEVGDVLRLSRNVTSNVTSGAAVDPDTLTLTVDKPSGTSLVWTVTNGQIVRTSLGVYYADVSLDEPGRWTYRWVGTGTNAFAAQGAFYVSAVAAV